MLGAVVLGRWPLLLGLVSRMLGAEMGYGADFSQALGSVDKLLESRGVTAFDVENTEKRSNAVALTLGTSLEYLTKEQDRRRCFELAVFPGDENIPIAAAEVLWEETDLGLKDSTLRKLASLALVKLNLRDKTFRTHDVIRSYFLANLPNLSSVHARLVDSYRRRCQDPGELHSGPDDGYFLGNIVFHLIESQQWPVLAELLTELRFLERRCAARQVPGLIRDYRRTLDMLPGRPDEKHEPRKRHLDDAKAYADAMMAYSRSRSGSASDRALLPLPPPIPSVRPLDNAGLPSAADSSDAISNRMARLREFSVFVNQRAHALLEFGAREGFVLQEAYSFSRDASLSDCAEQHLARLPNTVLLLPHLSCRARFNQKPTLVRTMTTADWHLAAVSVSWDGKRAVSGGNDNTLRVWDVDTGECLKELVGHEGYIRHTHVSPDGKRLCSSTYWRTSIRVWDLERWECVKHIDLSGGYEHFASEGLAVTPDMSRAVTGGGGGTLVLWDLNTGRCLKTVSRHKQNSKDICITADGRRAIWGAWDTVRIWDVETDASIALPTEHKQQINAVAMTPDGKLVATGGEDCTIRLWDVEAHQCVAVLCDHREPVRCLYLTPDGKVLLSGAGRQLGSNDVTVRVWDVNRRRCVGRLVGHTDAVTSVCATPDGRIAVSSSSDGTVRVWDLEGHEAATPQGHSETVSALITVPGSRTVLSGSVDGTIRAWDHDTGASSVPFDGSTKGISSLATDPRGALAVSGGSGDTLLRWGVSQRKRIGRFDRIILKDELVTFPDVFQERNGKPLTGPIPRWQAFESVCFSPDGRRVYSIESFLTTSFGRSRVLRIWDRTSKHWIARSEAINGFVTVLGDKLHLLPDGRRILYWDYINALGMWSTGTLVYTVLPQEVKPYFQCLAVSPEGYTVVIAHDNETLGLFDLRTRQFVGKLEGCPERITYVRFSADGSTMITAGSDNTVRVWDRASGDCIATYFVGDKCEAISEMTMTGEFFCGTSCGKVVLLKARNLAIQTPIVTPVRLWLDEGAGHGAWDAAVSIYCPWCRGREPVDRAVLGVISEMSRGVGLDEDDSPCLRLPSEAWDEPRLVSACPRCGNQIKHNPFVVDNRDRDDAGMFPSEFRKLHPWEEPGGKRDVFLFVYYGEGGDVEPSTIKGMECSADLPNWLSGVLKAMHEHRDQIPGDPAEYDVFDWNLNKILPESMTIGTIPQPGILIAVLRRIGNVYGRLYRLKVDATRDPNVGPSVEKFISDADGDDA